MPDLTTLAAVKNWLALQTNQYGADPLLSSIITATSADFLRATGRTDLMSAAYIETREGDGGSSLQLRHWPITAVSSITIAGTALPAQASGQSGYFFDLGIDPERTSRIYLQGLAFTDGAPIAVSYTAGYVDVPEDIAQAVAEWVALRYKSRPQQGLTSQRDAGGEHATYEKDEAMPANTARVIERYKRDWPTLDRRTESFERRVTRINRTIAEKVG